MLKNHEKLSFAGGDEVIEFEVIAKLSAHHKISIGDTWLQSTGGHTFGDWANATDSCSEKTQPLDLSTVASFPANEFIAPRQYVSGESHYYFWGKQYQLKVIESTDQPQGVKLLRGKLQVALKQKNTHKVQDLLNAWYRVRAKEVFSNRIEAVLPSFVGDGDA